MEPDQSIYALFAGTWLGAVRFDAGDDRAKWNAILDEARKYTVGRHDQSCPRVVHHDSLRAKPITPIEDLFESFLSLGVFDEEHPTSLGFEFGSDDQWATTCPDHIKQDATHYPAGWTDTLAEAWPFPYHWGDPVPVYEIPYATEVEELPDAEFPKFMSLPLEIRHEIYLETLEPQVVWLWQQPDYQNPLVAIDGRSVAFEDPHRPREWSDLPLLRVCRESRQLMISLFGIPKRRIWSANEDHKNYMPMSMPFCPALDTVRISLIYPAPYPRVVFDDPNSKVFKCERVQFGIGESRASNATIAAELSKTEWILGKFTNLRHLVLSTKAFDDCHFHENTEELGADDQVDIEHGLGGVYGLGHLLFLRKLKTMFFPTFKSLWLVQSDPEIRTCSASRLGPEFVWMRPHQLEAWSTDVAELPPFNPDQYRRREPVRYVAE
ncbi:hypothetical protein OQA88_7659 [Cercophora sp. LCS_1]